MGMSSQLLEVGHVANINMTGKPCDKNKVLTQQNIPCPPTLASNTDAYHVFLETSAFSLYFMHKGALAACKSAHQTHAMLVETRGGDWIP